MSIHSRLLITEPFLPPMGLHGLKNAFDASAIADLYQDDTLSTPVTANNDPVGGWVDKMKSTAQNVLQATGSKRPTYKTQAIKNHPGLLFDTGDFLDSVVTSASAPISYVVLFKSGTIGSTMGMICAYDNAAGGSRLHINSAGTLITQFGLTAVSRGHATSVPSDYAMFAIGGGDTTGVFIFANGTTREAAGTMSPPSSVLSFGKISLGLETSLFGGHLLEVYVYPRILTPEVRQLLYRYYRIRGLT